jgi:hypothetical protein
VVFTEQTSSASQVHREVPSRAPSPFMIPKHQVEQLTRVRRPKESVSRRVKGSLRKCRHCSRFTPRLRRGFLTRLRRNFQELHPPQIRRQPDELMLRRDPRHPNMSREPVCHPRSSPSTTLEFVSHLAFSEFIDDGSGVPYCGDTRARVVFQAP